MIYVLDIFDQGIMFYCLNNWCIIPESQIAKQQ